MKEDAPDLFSALLPPEEAEEKKKEEEGTKNFSSPSSVSSASGSSEREAELAALIEKHNRKYWDEGEPEISDDEYDALVRELAALNARHPLLLRVEAPLVAGNGKIRHAEPMLSLDKAYSLDEVMEWARKYARSAEERFLIQPKYDGISAIWKDGILATRGDGETGEDITDKAVLIELEHPSGNFFPLTGVPFPARGEIIIRDDDFRTLYSRIRNRNGRLYRNSRNAVAGIMGLKDLTEMRLQHAKLTLVDYSLHSWETSLSSLRKEWQDFVDKAESLPYPMDGIVLKLADADYSASLGSTAHHPRGQIAFKFSGVRRESRLLGVEWSFGKNCLTPVAEIEPVEISGTTIRRASLHNLQNILDKDLQIGDRVVVERAGDVIPYIVSSEPGESRRSCLIRFCPCCGAELVRKPPELCCVNPDCFETRLQRLLAAVKNIGIERLGEPNLRKMMTVLQVRTLSDIFRLSVRDLLRLEGFQSLSAGNLHREIQAARRVPDWQILASLNIRGIGPNIARSLLSGHSLSELREMSEESLSALNGIGPERAKALYEDLRAGAESLDELLGAVEVLESRNSPEEGDSPSSRVRETVCFTGKMPEKRSRYETLAEEHGYEAVDSVNSHLSLLVAMDPEENSSKLKKARSLHIPVMSLADWLEHLRNREDPQPLQTEENAGANSPAAQEQGHFSFN